MGRPLIYKLSTDDNGAPCVTDDLLTLAICKAYYRAVAKKGDFLFGFMGRTASPQQNEPLVYIAEITEDPVPVEDYYTNKDFSERPDCIYKKVGESFEIRSNVRSNAIYHNYEKGHIDKRGADLNSGKYVLLSRNFRYLGSQMKVIQQTKYPNLSNFLNKLNQTLYPPNNTISTIIFEECEQLIGQIWLEYNKMKIAAAMNLPSSDGDCADGSDMLIIGC